MLKTREDSNRKLFRSLIFSIMVFLIYLIFSSTSVYAAEGDVIDSGTTGDCDYELTELADGNYCLTISGDGAMEDYTNATKVPWYSYRSKIEKIEINGNLTTIGKCAFFNCISLTKIDLSSCTNLITIGECAFLGCTAITEINLDSCTNLTTIGDSAFSGCTAIAEINLDSCTNLITIGDSAFDYCTAIKEINLKSCTNLTTIGDYAFCDCTSLTEIDLSNCTNLTMLGGWAFEYCTSLKEINLSNCTNLAGISKGTFLGCISLTEIDLSGCSNLTYIYDEAFRFCESLESINLSGLTKLEYIGEYAFDYCESLTKVDLSNCSSIVAIYYCAFSQCYSLIEIDLSGCTNLSYIGEKAFESCNSLVEIDLSDCTALTEIASAVFDMCESLEKVELPTNITTIGDYAFYCCYNLQNIDFSSLTKLTSIGNYSFYYCRSMTEIVLPSSIQTIGNYTFSYCSLTNIDLSKCTSLESIGYYAFCTDYINSNEKVYMALPKNIYLYLYEGAIFSMYHESAWYDSYEGEYYLDSDGVAWYMDYNYDEAYISFIPAEITEYTVPEKISYNGNDYYVTSTNNCALFYSNDLEKLNFENTEIITAVDELSFAYCETLQSIDGYTTIDEINADFENYEIIDTMVEATQINPKYSLSLYIDLTDYTYYMEDIIKDELDVSELTSITLQLYCNGEVAEEVELDFENDEYEYVFENLELGNEYYIDVAHDNSRWGAETLYTNSGSGISGHACISIGTKYAYTVHVEVEDEAILEEVEGIEAGIYDDEGNLIETGILSESNNWTYVFYIKYFNITMPTAVLTNYTTDLIETKYEYTYEIEEEETIEEILTYNESYCYGYYDYNYTPGAVIKLTSCTPKESEVETEIGIEAIAVDGEEIEDNIITKEGQNITYQITYDVAIENYEGDAIITIVDSLPYEIEDDYQYILYVNDEEVQAESEYKDQAITWTINVADINTYDDSTTGEVSTQIILTVTYIDSNYGAALWTNQVAGTVYLVATEEETTQLQAEANTPIEILTSVKIEKLWNDNDNSDEKRPEYITVELYRYIDGQTEDEYETVKQIKIYPETVDEEEVWAGTFDSLSKYDAGGNEYIYEVAELSVDNYNSKIEDNEDGTFTITNTLQGPMLEITKTASITEDAKTDDEILYTIVIENTGNVALTGITLTDVIETAAGEEELDLYSDEECTEIITTIDELEIDEKVTIYAKYTVTQEDIDGQIILKNTITAKADDETTGEATATTITEGVIQKIDVTKEADLTEDVVAGDVITYIITITNTGNVTIENLEFEEVLSNGTKLTIYSDSECTEEITTIEKLEVGETKYLYVQYTVTQEDVDNQEIIANTFTVTAGDLEEKATAETTVAVVVEEEPKTEETTQTTDTTSTTDTTDDTISTETLPDTGIKTIIIFIIMVLIIAGIGLYIKYRTYSDIN